MVTVRLANLRPDLSHLVSSWHKDWAARTSPKGWPGSLAMVLGAAEHPFPSPVHHGDLSWGWGLPRWGALPERRRTVSEAITAKGGEVWALLLFLTC